ncbi:ANTAR domain-containing protein [Streptomyces echinatus]|uniref:ANTAR domain-containing protein n=1 Tax=Streptomyces echinatus TaxID=67293 RepID=UPI0037A11E39
MEHSHNGRPVQVATRPLPGQEVLEHEICQLKRQVGQLQEAVVSHAVVDQAIGVVITLGQLDPDTALRVLQQVSQHTNIKLRQVAEHLVVWARTKQLPDAVRQALDAALAETAD